MEIVMTMMILAVVFSILDMVMVVGAYRKQEIANRIFQCLAIMCMGFTLLFMFYIY